MKQSTRPTPLSDSPAPCPPTAQRCSLRIARSRPRASGIALLGLLALLAGFTTAHAGGCDLAPTANPDNAETANTTIVIDVLANDSDPLGLALSLTVLSNSCPNATVQVVADSLRLVPTADLLQNCQIHYRATNEEGESDDATVLVRQRTRIFSDGFESGDASAWTDCDPPCP